LEWDARELHQGDVFLVAEGSGIDNVGLNVEFLGDQLIGPSRGESIRIREILKDNHLTFASVPIEGRTKFFELMLLLG
jgi:hypothetical protein